MAEQPFKVTFELVDKKGKSTPLIVTDYRPYLDTGIIPWNPKRPSRKAKDLLRLLGLSWMIPKEKRNG
jgi:hypothetical protein